MKLVAEALLKFSVGLLLVGALIFLPAGTISDFSSLHHYIITHFIGKVYC